MKNNNKGCFIVIGIIALIFLAIQATNFYKHSQAGMMREARRSTNSYSPSTYYYEEYLEAYPTGRYKAEADDSIFSICCRNYERYEAYKQYMEILPHGNHVREIDSMATLAYNKVKENPTIEGWDEFMDNFPEVFHRDASEQIQKIKEEQERLAWATEATAWETASKLNTNDAYTKYLDMYPKGKHAKQAIDKQVALIMGSSHGEMPKMERGYSTGESYSTIEVENGTQYRLNVLYSGPQSKQVSLSPYQTQTFRLANGTYRIAVSAPGAVDVIPYAGTEHLTGGGYSSRFYISRY